MEQALIHVLTKFPDQVGKIIDLYQGDENFRELCEDFLLSTETLIEYKMNAVKNNEYEKHVSQMLEELEKEIIALLKKQDPDIGSPF